MATVAPDYIGVEIPEITEFFSGQFKIDGNQTFELRKAQVEMALRVERALLEKAASALRGGYRDRKDDRLPTLRSCSAKAGSRPYMISVGQRMLSGG